MKKELYVGEVVNIVGFFNNLKKETMDEIPLKIKWYLKRAVDQMLPDCKRFEEFRATEVEKLNKVYFDEEHSITEMVAKTDDDGNPIIDGEGNEITEETRKVKPEYLEEYQNTVKEINKKLEEIMLEKNTYEYNSLNIDDYIDVIDEKKIDFETLSTIDAILKE